MGALSMLSHIVKSNAIQKTVGIIIKKYAIYQVFINAQKVYPLTSPRVNEPVYIHSLYI